MSKVLRKNMLSDILIEKGVFIVDNLELGNTGKRVQVVRDDFVEGGTKARVLHKKLIDFAKGKELVYPATPYGYGQLALSVAANTLNREVRIFGPKLEKRSSSQQCAVDYGAVLEEIDLEGGAFDEITDYAIRYAQADPEKRVYLNAGFDSQEFIDLTADAIMSIREQLREEPSQVWAIGGSGALSAALQKVFPNSDHRIVTVRHTGSQYGVDCNKRDASRVYGAPEAFAEVAKYPPSFASSEHYESKLWNVLIGCSDEVEPNSLVWNM